MQRCKDRLATLIQEFLGIDILIELLRLPRWRDDLNPVLEVTATGEPFENGRGFSLRVLRADKPMFCRRLHFHGDFLTGVNFAANNLVRFRD
jgi:hypothetical protein